MRVRQRRGATLPPPGAPVAQVCQRGTIAAARQFTYTNNDAESEYEREYKNRYIGKVRGDDMNH
jgi:hypothetical protein